MQNLAIHQKQTMVGKINWKKKKKSHVCEQVLGTGNFEYSQRKEWEPEWVFEQSKKRKKAPDWSTSFSIEGLSFFLFTPSLKRKPGEGEGKKWKETKKKLRKEKRKKEKGKTERKKEACDKPSPNAGNTFGKQQIDSKN